MRRLDWVLAAREERHFDYRIPDYTDCNTPSGRISRGKIEPERETPPDGDIICWSKSSGWLKSYERRAA